MAQETREETLRKIAWHLLTLTEEELRLVRSFIKGIKITYSSNAELMIPKRKISLKNRIFHNKIVYNIGLRLFPQGSKIRNTLKSKM